MLRFRSSARLLWALTLLVLPAGGCAYSFTYVDGTHIDDVDPDDLLDAVLEAHRTGDYDEAAHLAEYIVEYYPEGFRGEEALYLAGDSYFQTGDMWDSYTSFKNLLARFPHSQYIEQIAERDYAIGEFYLYRPPGTFGHLFTSRSRGVTVMSHLVTYFSRHSLADDAQMAIAEFHFKNEDFEDAAEAYGRLVKNYPTSEWVEKATFMLGVSYKNSSKGIAYDREPLLRAYTALDKYLKRYPKGSYAEDAASISVGLKEMVAQKELDIALFYFNQDALFGARIHLANILIVLPETEVAKKAEKIMAEQGWDLSIHAVDQMVPRESMTYLSW
jgi:outer membrane assembly lipoprotein YfiO